MLRALAGQVEGDAGDALDLVRGVDGGVDGALLAVLERDDLLGLAEIGAARQLAQDQDIEALDVLALERRGFREPRIADGRPQVGEQVELLAQPQQPGLGPDVVGHLVPLRAADGAEHDGVGGARLGQRLLGQRRAVLVDGGAADQRGVGLELDLALPVEEGDETLDLGHHLGPMPSPGSSRSECVVMRVVPMRPCCVSRGIASSDRAAAQGNDRPTDRAQLFFCPRPSELASSIGKGKTMVELFSPAMFDSVAEVAQLHRLGALGEDLAGLRQPLRGLQLALGVDDLGAPQALGLGLLGDGADHGLVEVDVLELDVADLDAPGVGSARPECAALRR